MRALRILVVVMGVLIVAGTVALVWVIAGRLSVPVGAAPSGLIRLQEPAGTRIAGIAATGDRLAISLQGGGADRILLVDPHSLRVVGRLELAP